MRDGRRERVPTTTSPSSRYSGGYRAASIGGGRTVFSSDIDGVSAAPVNPNVPEEKNNVSRDPCTTLSTYLERNRGRRRERFSTFTWVRGERKLRLICTAKVFVTGEHSRTQLLVQKSILPRAVPKTIRTDPSTATRQPVIRHPLPCSPGGAHRLFRTRHQHYTCLHLQQATRAPSRAQIDFNANPDIQLIPPLIRLLF